MSKHIFIYEIDGLTEDKVTDKLRDFYKANADEPKEISMTPQAYNAIFPYHKQQVKSIRSIPLVVTADRITPLVVIS